MQMLVGLGNPTIRGLEDLLINKFPRRVKDGYPMDIMEATTGREGLADCFRETEPATMEP